MFSGIVEQLGRVRHLSRTDLSIELGPLADGTRHGASIAVNGVCLTVAALNHDIARFDVVPETWRRTALGEIKVGDSVNLERSLRVGDRIDGHFVQGHVDAVGTVVRVERDGGEWRLIVATPPNMRDYLIPKGSIAIDGTSLTLADVAADEFAVALIPTTLEKTILGQRHPGDRVNLESDLLARVLVHRLRGLTQQDAPGGDTASSAADTVLVELLRAGGFTP